MEVHGSGGCYYGVFGYADDLALFSNSRSQLQCMLELTEKYAEEFNIEFSTNANIAKSKTKGMTFGSQKRDAIPAKLVLKGKVLPWGNR